MGLLTPVVTGPLTEWSDSLLVIGALPGATVRARTIGPNPRDVAKSVVGGGSDRIPLLPGERLRAGDIVLVRQALAAEASGWTPDHLGADVGAVPTDHADLAPLSFTSRAWECGRRVRVRGAVPGARVAVSGPGGLLSEGRATESGDARLALAAPVPGPGGSIAARQGAPAGYTPLAGAPKTATVTGEQLPVPGGGQLPPPVLGGDPPRGCDATVSIAGVYDGAEVTILRRSDGSTETSVFDYHRLTFVLGKPLDAAGDRLEITQAMPGCRERRASEPLNVDVAPAVKPGAPSVQVPCAGGVDVLVGGLEPGSLVTLTYQGRAYRGMTPSSGTSLVARLEPLTGGETVSVVQERCGLESAPGTAAVPGISLVASLLPDLIDPLTGCARVVRAMVVPGAWVQVWARVGGGEAPISNQLLATSDSVQIPVTPYLHEGQDVWLRYVLCGGGGWEESRRHTVEATRHTGPANLTEPLVEGARHVTVDAHPGAAVRVYAISGWPITVQPIGSGFVDPLVRRIGLTRALTTRDLVYAEQHLCSERPGVGATRTVLPGVRTFTLGAPISQLSRRNDPKPLVCTSAAVTIRHNGSWEFTAYVENQETKADCSFDVQFRLVAVSSPFGAVLPGDLSMKGGTEGTVLLGIPSSRTFSRQGNSAALTSPAYWEEVLGANYVFEFGAVAWQDYAGYPEEPDSEDPPDA